MLLLVLGPPGAGKTTLLNKLSEEFPVEFKIVKIDELTSEFGFSVGWLKALEAARQKGDIVFESVGLYWKNDQNLAKQDNTRVIVLYGSKEMLVQRLSERHDKKQYSLTARLDEIRCMERALELLPNLYPSATFIELQENIDASYEQFRASVLSHRSDSNRAGD